MNAGGFLRATGPVRQDFPDLSLTQMLHRLKECESYHELPVLSRAQSSCSELPLSVSKRCVCVLCVFNVDGVVASRQAEKTRPTVTTARPTNLVQHLQLRCLENYTSSSA